MEFRTLFSVLRKRLSDGYDVPMYCRELFAQLTDVSEVHLQSVARQKSLRKRSCIG